jgi:hypothetical protein
MLNISEIKLEENDAGASTIGQYLGQLLLTLWEEGECFSGKRPFGNSGWEYEIYRGLIQAGAVAGTVDEYGDIQTVDEKAANQLISNHITQLFQLSKSA